MVQSENINVQNYTVFPTGISSASRIEFLEKGKGILHDSLELIRSTSDNFVTSTRRIHFPGHVNLLEDGSVVISRITPGQIDRDMTMEKPKAYEEIKELYRRLSAFYLE